MLDHTPIPVLVLLGFTTFGFAFFAYRTWKAAKLAHEMEINERFEDAYREIYRMEGEWEKRIEEIRRETSVPCLSPKEIALINRNKK